MRSIEGDRHARLCRTCDTPVNDSRSMTRGELYRLIVKHEGSLPSVGSENKPQFAGVRTPDNAFSVNPRPLRLPPECTFSRIRFPLAPRSGGGLGRGVRSD